MIALLLAAEVVLQTGGDLPGPPEQTTVEQGADVLAYGFSEVPPNSRLQAAYAVSDAVARAELIKLVRVRVEDSLKARQTLTEQEVESRTREVSRGLLPAISPARHGWRKVKRGDEVVLQVWSRISVPKAVLGELTK